MLLLFTAEDSDLSQCPEHRSCVRSVCEWNLQLKDGKNLKTLRTEERQLAECRNLGRTAPTTTSRRCLMQLDSEEWGKCEDVVIGKQEGILGSKKKGGGIRINFSNESLE